jgi:hypothetical protein
VCRTGIGEESSCNMLHLDFSAQHSRSPSWNHNCETEVKNRRVGDEARSYLTKLCHSTPVGSSSTRTNTETSAHSSSIVGLLCPSWMVNSLRSSLNRVKPQSHSSAIKRWCASRRPNQFYSLILVETRTADSVYSRIVRVGDNQGKLGTCMPTLRRSFRISIIEVDGDRVIWRGI